MAHPTPMPDPKTKPDSLGSLIIRRIENIPPILGLAVMALVGVLLTLGSSGAHLNSVYFPGIKKQLGYWHEINWSVNYSFVIPIAFFFALASLNSAVQVIKNLAASQMIVRSDVTPKSERELLESYHRAAGIAVYVAFALCVCAFAFSWHEYYVDCFYNGNPLTLEPTSNGLLPGWNLAPTISSTGASAFSVKLFGFFAFTAEAVAGSIFLIFCTIIITFSSWIYHYTSESVGDELVPNVLSPDPRRGFEHFEPFIRYVLLSSLAFFGVFFLTRLNGAYILSGESTLWQVVKTDILLGFASSLTEVLKTPSQLFFVGPNITQPIVTVGLAMGLTIVFSFIVPVMIVGVSASDSKARCRVNPLRAKLLKQVQITPQEFDQSLGMMVIWPLRYPKPVQLLFFLALAGSCFVFYRITLLLIGLIVFVSLRSVYKLLADGA